ncbi:MAG: siroheme decarboxylase [Desulfonauticus sp.]|nr:MAG: Putative transcriptional regulator, AsnC family [Desulfonauticus sp. 38_4375]MDK2921014.1 siroheme decarboxylase [Desulfonauticus sp.]
MRYSLDFSNEELAILKEVQGDIPLSPTPFQEIARKVGVKEEVVLNLLKKLKEKGYIRRFGATLRHQQAGYDQNAMVAWKVPGERVEEVGKIFASRKEITHCYERITYPSWPYNLYTMIHATSEEECKQVIAELSKLTGIKDFEVLESIKELKKISMEYF